MTDYETRGLIAEARKYAKKKRGNGWIDMADIVDRLADALEAATEELERERRRGAARQRFVAETARHNEQLLAERDAALAAIERVRELHQAREDGWCSACAETNDQTGEFQDFPCPTIRALLAALDGAPEPEEKP